MSSPSVVSQPSWGRLFACVAAAAAAVSLGATAAPGQISSTIGANFTTATLGESGFIPPDTMGGVSGSHVVTLVNGRYEVHSKTGSVLTQSSLQTFWTNAGVSPTGSAFDPRVIYDPGARRWYAVSVDNARAANNLLIAVSRSANPLDGWTGFSIDADSDDVQWADFPVLGFNSEGVYVTSSMFAISSGPFTNNMLVLPKGDLLAATPSIANRTYLEGWDSGGSWQPLVDYDNSTAKQAFVRAPAFVSSSGNFSNRIEIRRLTGTITSPAVSNTTSTTVTSYFEMADPLQPDPAAPALDATDLRLHSNVVRVNGSIWGVQNVAVGGRGAIRWFQLNATTGTRIREGVITDPELSFLYSSIAVSPDGRIVIGTSGVGTNPGQEPSTYAIVGRTDFSALPTFNPLILLKDGTASYNRVSSGRNRFGDYSATVVDPADPGIFWTFQEWTSPTNQWNTQATELQTTVAGEARWEDGVSGLYSSGGSWSSGSTPLATDEVIFSRGNANFTVTLPEAAAMSRLSVRQGNVVFFGSGSTINATSAASSPAGVTVAPFQGTATLNLVGTAVSSNHIAVAPSAGGTGTLIVGSGSLLDVASTMSVGGSATAAGGVGALVISAGGRVEVGESLRVWAGSSVTVNATGLAINTGSLQIENGGQLTAGDDVEAVIATQSLSITGTGFVDLNRGNTLVVDYSGDSPFDAVLALVASGYGSVGSWAGPGIRSSGANRENAGLAVVEATDPVVGVSFAGGVGSLGVAEFDQTAVLVVYAILGDINLSGAVDFNDLGVLLGRYDQPGTWTDGDFDYNGIVDFDDLGELLAMYGGSQSAAVAALDAAGLSEFAVAVPEPRTALWAGLAAGVAALHRRRRSGA